MTTTHASAKRAGWSETERAQLFSLADAALAARKPLRAVFEEAASLTGRRTNSIRNYYYACRRADGGEQAYARRAFQPFSATEAERLMEAVLSAQAAGESVRSCTLRLAAGDDKTMLRFQNKYRSMLKNAPQQVRRIYAEMLAAGKPAFDPYADRGAVPRVGRPPKGDAPLDALALRTLANLRRVPGLDVNALFDALGKLALSAVSGVSGQTTRDEALRSENVALKRQLTLQEERYRTLLSYSAQLIRINEEFLSRNSAEKCGDLSNYIRDLESNVRHYEQLMIETAT